MTTPDAVVQEIAIAASAARIFAALTDPDQRARWWGLRGAYEVTGTTSDLRPGGAWSMVGRRGDTPFLVRGTYREIRSPQLLEFTWAPDWQPDLPETVIRFDLEERGGETIVRLTHSGFTEAGQRDLYRGWGQLLHSLRGYLDGTA